MFDFDKWQEIFDSIWRHKLRTFLTAFGVFWGIFMLVLLLGAGKGLSNGSEKNFRDDATNSLFLYGGKTTKPYKGLPPGRYISFTNDDYDLLNNHISGIEHLSGRYNLRGEFTINRKNKSTSYTVRTVHPDHLYIENTIITKGRYINNIDIKEKRKVACIGKKVVEGLFEPDEEPIGDHITIKNVDYQVIGTYEDEGGDDEMRIIYLPISTCQLIEGTNRIHQMMMTTGDATVAESKLIEDDLLKQLALQHKFDPEDKNALWIRNISENVQQFRSVMTGINGFIWFVSLGTIIAGIIGVSNIMLIIVKDRTKEIGVRKAMGATPWSIITMIVQESVLITTIAGYFGLLTGVAIIHGMKVLMETFKLDNDYFSNPEVDFQVALTALILLILAGAIAGLIPALQAARVNPVVAMRAD